MFRPLARSHRRPARRGTSFILIVVVMLSIIAAGGVAFSLLALQVKQTTGLHKDANGGNGITQPKTPDPTYTVNRFLSALIYDVGDDAYEDVTNGLRGHSFAASMYGRTPGNTTPFAGVGTFHEDGSGYRYGVTGPAYGLTLDRARYVNYTLATINGQPLLLDPEWTGHRGAAGTWPANFASSQPGRAYVGKHAGYSYPDLKDFFLAQVDPATGEVLTPSFHRSWHFGSLQPNAANWYNAEGRLLTLRPRPQEHPQFPRVPQDPDGQYRGDVQNWPGGVGPQRNDSLWMNLGLPVVPMGNKRVQPLVAPLIVPLNALFNASAHGNTFGGWAHRSHAGYGPWEVNMGYGLSGNETDRQNVIGINNGAAPPVWNGRGPRQQRAGLATRAYAPYSAGTLPSHAPVAWHGAAVGLPAYPGGNNLTGIPGFAAAGFLDNNLTVNDHPALFNPSEWPSAQTFANRTYSVGDIKRLNFRYAFTPHWYSETDLGPNAPTALRGTYPFTFATGQNTRHDYRLDPAHANRALFTARSFDLDRPKVVPNFVDRTGNNALSYGTGPGGPNKSGVVMPNAYPAPQVLGAVSDFAAADRWVNAMARLGSVDVNRPLTDYRTDTTAPLSATNPNTGNAAGAQQLALATEDRQLLARDIFTRFVAALGAGARVNLTSPNTGVPNTPTGPYTVLADRIANPSQYNALRYLAQLAVNIVDYVDNDDISTVFVWNPDPATGTADFTSPTDVDARVVFGHEKARLVINEVYSEIVNNPTDPVVNTVMGVNQPLPAASLAHVRFWAELLNPTPALTAASASGANPLNTGSAPLSAYRIEIARANRANGVALPAQQGLIGAYLQEPANVTGRFGATGAPNVIVPDVAFNLSNIAAAAGVTVGPNGGTTYNPNGVPAGGVALIGPQLDQTAGQIKGNEYNPNAAAAPWSNGILIDRITNPPGAGNGVASSPTMAYTMPMPAAGALPGTEYRRHTVLLRRLANPYLPSGNSNPWVTVDVMDYVPAFDAVNRAVGQSNPRVPRPAAPANNGTEYDPVGERFAVGKVQPYAGHAAATLSNVAGTYNVYTFPNSMVVPQNPNGGPPAGEPKHTFGRHNGQHTGTVGDTLPNASSFAPGGGATVPALNNTLMFPFDWLVHVDRPLVNQLELLQVRDTPPHRVTDFFVLPYVQAANVYNAPGVTYDFGYANWRAIHDGVARAMEFLAVKPHAVGVAHGGRVPGKLNINGIQDRRVLQGLFDQNGSNNFGPAFVDNAAWAGWLNSRTAVEQATLADGSSQAFRARAASGNSLEGFGGDRPFLPFGAPAAGPNTNPFPFAFPSGGNIDQTILRRPPPAAAPPAPGPYPYLYTNAGNTTAAFPPTNPDGPDYYRAEPVRKVMNNLTTVNHQYLVIFTVGYFEVVGSVATANGGTIPQLGPEAYVKIPGDSRQQFVAVVDMSNMALDPATGAASTEQPFFTSLERTVRPTGPFGTGTLLIAHSRHDGSGLYVGADGQEVAVGARLVLGYGTEEQVVTVSSLGPAAGEVQVTGMTRTAWAGSSVSNVRPGYPGPQPAFRPEDAAYKAVVPYLDKVR